MYEEFCSDYDRFVNWQSRLAAEMPFITQQLEAVGAKRVLDAACGTGMHTLELASLGYSVVGTDYSDGMINVARQHSDRAQARATFLVAAFGELRQRVGNDFDAVLCLGNSLPHAVTPDLLHATLDDFRACLRPNGLLLIQNRNLDSVLAKQDRWMSPQGFRADRDEWLFVRFYDFENDGSLTFNVLTLQREGQSTWSQRAVATRLWPLRQFELDAALLRSGFDRVTWWGDMQGTLFDVTESPNLVVAALASGDWAGGRQTQATDGRKE
jgi:SAM-dependent methyltransferase